MLDEYKRELGEFVSVVSGDTQQALGRLVAAAQPSGAPAGTFSSCGADDLDAFLAIPASDLPLTALKALEELSGSPLEVPEDPEQLQALNERFVGESSMSEDEFWKRVRYFEHVKRRQRLLDATHNENEDEDVSWGDEDEVETENQDLAEMRKGMLEAMEARAIAAEKRVMELEGEVEKLHAELDELKNATQVEKSSDENASAPEIKNAQESSVATPQEKKVIESDRKSDDDSWDTLE